MSVKYCTICRGLLPKNPIKANYLQKRYYICSEKCRKQYVQDIWRDAKDKAKDVPQEIEEFPDY